MAKSQRPYLIRALHDWLLDNGHTPFLLVAAGEPGVMVPPQHVSKDGKIILNLSPRAVQGLQLGNEEIRFTARFSGASFTVIVPPEAVLAIYAKETGEGMMFGESTTGEGKSQADTPDAEPPPPAGDGGGKRSHLRLVK
ncbi:MAG: ClpXP protease specificity-enhancing factor [Nevskiales bacterium]